MIFLISALMACGEERLSYNCTCIQIAYNDGEEAEVDETFSINICETEKVMDEAYEDNGVITTEIQACEDRLEANYQEADCECDCEYQGEC